MASMLNVIFIKTMRLVKKEQLKHFTLEKIAYRLRLINHIKIKLIFISNLNEKIL